MLQSATVFCSFFFDGIIKLSLSFQIGCFFGVIRFNEGKGIPKVRYLNYLTCTAGPGKQEVGGDDCCLIELLNGSDGSD